MDACCTATRRGVIGGMIAALVLAPPRLALARPSLQEAVAGFTGGAEVQEGRVTLEIAPLVENGNAVGLSVGVDSPMQPEDFVRRIGLFNERNPQADIAVFHLGPRAGRAAVSTRIRLATSQQVVAVAEMSDGSFWAQSGSVIVTLAACIESL